MSNTCGIAVKFGVSGCWNDFANALAIFGSLKCGNGGGGGGVCSVGRVVGRGGGTPGGRGSVSIFAGNSSACPANIPSLSEPAPAASMAGGSFREVFTFCRGIG